MNSKLLRELHFHEISVLSDSELEFLEDVNSAVKSRSSNAATKVPSSLEKEVKAFINQAEEVQEKISTIIKRLRSVIDRKTHFVEAYPIWKNNRKDTIQAFREIINSRIFRFNGNMIKLIGNGVFFLAGVLLTAGVDKSSVVRIVIMLWHITFLIPFVAGEVEVKKSKEVIKKDSKYCKEMTHWLTDASEVQEDISIIKTIKVVRDLEKDVKQFIENAFHIANGNKKQKCIRRGLDSLFNYFPETIWNTVPAVAGALLVNLIAFYLLLQNSKNRLLLDGLQYSIIITRNLEYQS